MEDKEKTKEQLMDELVKLRQQITELQKSEIKHRQAEETLRENEEKYRILVEMATDGILIETVEGRILECNTATAKIYGYTKDEMIGLTLADLVPEEFAEKLPKVITDKETTHGIFLPRISKKKDGTIFPTEIASKIINIAGKPRLIAYIRDITKRKETEKKLRKARKMFASLFNSNPEPALYYDKENRIININPRFTELFGYTPKEMIGKKIDEGMIYPANKIKEGKILTQKAFNGFSDYETIRKKKDGTLVPVIISTAPVIIDKSPQGIIVLYRDITERKKTEDTLRKSQQEFAGLFKSSPQAAIYHDEKGVILNINPRFTELFGYALKEVKGKNIDQGMIFPQNKTREESERLTKLALEGKIVEYETIRKKKDGTLIPVIISTSSVVMKEKNKGIIAFYQDTTKQKKILEKLKENEEKYRNLFENMPGAYYRTNKDGNLTMINPEGAKLFGYNSPEDILGKNISQHFYFAPEERKKYFKELQKKKGNLKDFELTLKKKDGSPLVISDTSHYYYNKEGSTVGVEGIFVDITERKKTEEALQKSQQEFSSLFKSSPEALVYLDGEANILDINSYFTKLFGFTLEEVKGRNIDDGMIHLPDKIEEGKRLSKNGFEERLNYETVRKKKDGTLFPVRISSSPLIIKGEKKGFIAIYQDITERKKAEETLRKSQQEFASLFHSTPEALVYLDENSNILNINSLFTELFGYTLEEVKGRNIDDGIIHSPDKMKEGKWLTKKSLKGHFYFETIRKKKDSTLFPVAISGSQVIIDGQLKGMIGIFQDITERKKTEETLQKSQQEFASLFNSSPEALVYLDEKGNIIDINPRFNELFGYTLEELKGKNINEGMIHPPNKVEEGKNLDKIALNKGYSHYETIRKKKDGTLFPVSISVANIKIDGQIKGLIGTFLDITERKILEEKLEKLAHYDVLTGCCSRGHGLALLEQQINTANRKKTPIMLFYLDMDKFKYINDTFGHEEGDMVLKEGVKLFKSTLRKNDIICRMGGDEFLLIFLESFLNNAPLIRERLNKNLKKLNQKLAKPYEIDFSIGFSVYDPSNPLSMEKLIKIADENMYEEKKKKKEGF